MKFDKQTEMDALAAYLQKRGLSDSESAPFLAYCLGRMVAANAASVADARAALETLHRTMMAAAVEKLNADGKTLR